MHAHDEGVLAAIPNGEDNPVWSIAQAQLAHDLIGGARRLELPALYTTEQEGDAAIVKFKCFSPWGNWTWYATEFDGEDICFGFVVGHDSELGYFSLQELQEIRGAHGLRIERDLHWTPKPLGDVRRSHARS